MTFWLLYIVWSNLIFSGPFISYYFLFLGRLSYVDRTNTWEILATTISNSCDYIMFKLHNPYCFLLLSNTAILCFTSIVFKLQKYLYKCPNLSKNSLFEPVHRYQDIYEPWDQRTFGYYLFVSQTILWQQIRLQVEKGEILFLWP